MMKKLFGVTLIVLLVAGGLCNQTAEAGVKKALGEMFTNTSCGPCKAANNLVDIWTDPTHPAYIADWIVIRYHTWWPSASDPFYAANKSENTARTNYYGVNYVPDMWLGDVHGTSNYGSWGALATQQIGEATPYNMKLHGSFDIVTGELKVDAHVWIDDTLNNSTHRIFFVVTQDEVNWNAPNGQTVFYQAMVKMINGSGGTPISMFDGDYHVYSQTYTLDPDWPKSTINVDWNKTNIVVFVQSYTNKRIKQVEASRLVDLTPGPTLWANRTFESAAVGVDVDLNLDAGDAYAGRNYFVLGSLSGTVPGIPLPGGNVLPLNWDPFLGIVISAANTPFFANFQSTLDANGQETANFNTFGPVDPAMVGLTFSFAYTTFSPFDMVSNPVDIKLEP